MNVWFLGAVPLLLGLVACAVVAARGRAMDGLVSIELASALAVVTLLILEQGMQRQTFFDVSLALAVLTLPSTLLFARTYRRWL